MDEHFTDLASSTPPPPRPSWDATGLLTLINGVLVGVGSVYLATGSITITLIAGVLAITLGSLALIVHR